MKMIKFSFLKKLILIYILKILIRKWKNKINKQKKYCECKRVIIILFYYIVINKHIS